MNSVNQGILRFAYIFKLEGLWTNVSLLYEDEVEFDRNVQETDGVFLYQRRYQAR